MTVVELVCIALEGAKDLPDGAILGRSRAGRVREARREAYLALKRWGMSQEEIAAAFGRDRTTVLQVLNGRKRGKAA